MAIFTCGFVVASNGHVPSNFRPNFLSVVKGFYKKIDDDGEIISVCPIFESVRMDMYETLHAIFKNLLAELIEKDVGISMDVEDIVEQTRRKVLCAYAIDKASNNDGILTQLKLVTFSDTDN